MAGIDRRGALRLAGAVGAAGLTSGLAAACGTTRDTGQTDPLHDSHVRIGLLIPAAGGYRAIGEDIGNGFRRFLAANGNRLGGHPYVIQQEDEGDSPADAVAALERLLELDVHAVVGVATSGALLEVSPVVEAANVPLLAANASPQELQGVPYIWRTSFVNQEPGLALGGHMAGAADGPVAIIAQDDATGTDAVEGLREAYAIADASDLLTDPILTPTVGQPDDGHFSVPLAQAEALDARAYFASYAGVAAAEFIRQYLAAGLDPRRLYGPADLTEGVTLDQLEAGAVGIKTAANYAPELTGAVNRSFTVAYRAEYSRAPSVYAVAGYDAAAVLDRAVRLTDGDPSGRQINLTLGEVGLIDSPRGQWQFNQSRTPTQKWYLREVADDGPVLSNVVISELGTLG